MRMLGCGLGAAVLGACATPGYNPARIQSELVKAGATRPQAECVTRELPNQIDENALGSHSAPSAVTTDTDPKTKKPIENEYERTRDVLKTCGVTLPLVPLPTP